jgi:hypothetical protein
MPFEGTIILGARIAVKRVSVAASIMAPKRKATAAAKPRTKKTKAESAVPELATKAENASNVQLIIERWYSISVLASAVREV